MKEKDLFLNKENEIVRLLVLLNTEAIVLNCSRFRMPYRISVDELEAMHPISSNAYTVIINEYDMPDWAIKERDRRWASIEGLTSEDVVVDKILRNRLLCEKSIESGYSRRTLSTYLWKYWVYQSKNGLLPKIREQQKENNTEDEKNFRWALNKFYYTSQKQTLQMAYKMMLREKYCDTRGILEEYFPSYWQFRYYFRQHRNPINEIISREGLRAYQRNYRPFTGSTQDYVQTIGTFMTDATEADLYIVSKLTRKPIGRPIIYTMVDTYSHLITGIYVGLDNGSDALRMLILNVCQNKKEFCHMKGIEIKDYEWPAQHLPKKIMTDRGSEFMGGPLENLCESFGIEVENLPAYRPDLKGVVEKLFDLIQNSYKPLLKGKGVIEPDFQERGAPDYRRQSTVDLEQFTQIVLKCVIYLNTRQIISGFKRTPDMIEMEIPARPADIWLFCQKQKEASIISIDTKKLMFALLPRTVGKMTQRGLEAFGVCYDNVAFKQRFVSAGLKGRECVRVSYNPMDIGRVWLYERGDYHEFILTAKQYRGHSLDELIDVRKKEKQKYDDLRLETLQAELDLIKDITEIANEATGVKEVGTRLGEKIRRNRETAISESDEDIYSLMRELQESEWNEQ